jgi:hypothetical protein
LSGIADPQLQVRALQDLARNIPAEGKSQATMLWENEHGAAGVTVTADKYIVFLFGGEQEVESMAAAGELLQAIFAGKVAVVQAFANEQFVYQGLAPTGDPASAFNLTNDKEDDNLDKPSADYVTISTWSRGLHEETE